VLYSGGFSVSKKMMGGFSVVEEAAAASGKRENGDGNSYAHSQHRRSKRYSFQTYLSIVSYFLWFFFPKQIRKWVFKLLRET
jgi:hypothetical protein